LSSSDWGSGCPGGPPGPTIAPVPPTVKALYVPPRAQRQRREVRAPTYRLTLEREGGAGEVIHTWGGIPHERVGPLLQTMQAYLPWIARAAAARDALAKLMDLFR